MTAEVTMPAMRVGSHRIRVGRATILFALLSVGLVAAVIVAAGHGQLDIPAREVVGSVLHRLGLDIGPMPHAPQGENTLWQVRFPRVATAIVVRPEPR